MKSGTTISSESGKVLWILQDDLKWKKFGNIVEEPKEFDPVTSKPFDLPTDSQERKAIPLWSGLFKYFPNALAEVAKVSLAGNNKHNPSEELHWARGKSMDQQDCVLRHMVDSESGYRDKDGLFHKALVAWRSLADCQLELEKEEWERTHVSANSST